ncbi:hypothetical protein H1164_17445 [Thermoactinomyces daqus]|uniref:Uncharacterized protein n=1 Tax=Thermoactinomyces daqus TaxID=1329516 RepID=A0A7W1XDF9_9BACL|nr:hypothetical protein [Thermoactinomyces daqus]MBA4544615.1 hypothetical protein [Thermoactinomyces daqus]
MFHWFRRIFPPAELLILVFCLRLAAWFYPQTRTSLTRLLAPYQSPLAEWGNVLVSVCIAFDALLLGVFLLLAVRTFLSWLMSLIRRDDRYRELETFLLGWAVQAAYYALAILFFLDFIQIHGPLNYWTAFFKPAIIIAIRVIPPILSVFSTVVWCVAVMAIIAWAGFLIYDNRAKLRTIYRKLKG